MEEVLEFTKFAYSEGVAFIPWLVFGMLCFLIIKLYPSATEYLEERTRTHSARVQLEAERNEIVRNNTAAINNNTACLEGVNRERAAMLNAIAELDQKTQLYDARIEAKIENANRDMLEVGRDIEVIRENVRDCNK